MNVVVALNESEPWHGLLGPATELGSLLSSSPNLLLINGSPAFEAGVLASIPASGPARKPTIRHLDSAPAADVFDTWDQLETVLVTSCGSTAASASVSLARQCDWNGLTLFVPGACNRVHRPYADRLIAISPEAGTFDSIETWAARFGRHAGCLFVLLTVIASDSEPTALNLDRRFAAARRRLGQLADRLRNAGVRTTWEVRMGDLAAEIIRLAETTGTDLILLPKPGPELRDEGIISALTASSLLHILLDD